MFCSLQAFGSVSTMVGLSETKVLYSQDSTPSLNQWQHSLKGGIEVRREDSRWSVGLTGYATLAPSFKASGDIARLNFYGANLRANYLLTDAKRFKFSIASGFYFATTKAVNYSGGYQNLNGPQIYPYFRYFIKKQGSIAGYLKYSPIGSNFSLLSIDQNHEMAFGLTYYFKNGFISDSTGITFDFSEIRFVDSSSVTVISRTASVGLVFVFGS